MQTQSPEMIHVSANLLPRDGITEGAEGGALPSPVGGLGSSPRAVLNSENLSDSLNPLEPRWPICPGL